VNNLKVPLSLITDEGVTIDVEVPAGELPQAGAKGIPVRAVRLVGRLVDVSDEFIFRGTLSGAFCDACDRCLEEVECPFQVSVEWLFAQGASAREEHKPERDGEAEVEVVLDEEYVFYFQGNEIDLARPLWEEVVLAIPAKFLCRPDCAGLCPQCGANLNRTVCRCRDRDTRKHIGGDRAASEGLSGLADLFPNLRPKDPEE
jgi:uncharacterized protein